MKEQSCTIPNCNRPHKALGLCHLHYDRKRRNISMDQPFNKKRRRRPEFCSVPECEKRHYGLGYCLIHYTRLRKNGSLFTTRKPYRSTEGICDIKGCEKPVEYDGLCNTHIGVLAKHGYDPRNPFTCYICGKYWDTWPRNKSIAFDHIIPKSRGGTITVPVCYSCNHRKHNATIDEVVEWCRKVIQHYENSSPNLQND